MMADKKIENYELPGSQHANKGLLVHLFVMILSFIAYVSVGFSLYILLPITASLLVVNFIYWFNKDHDNYTQYQNAYINHLKLLDIALIKSKIIESGFGTNTERFLTSYLIKNHPNSINSCPDHMSNIDYECSNTSPRN
jgi:hypothetical protein